MTAQNGKIFDDETRQVEQFLRDHGFPSTECYRPEQYSSLLRVRIIDDRFRGLSRLQREDLVEPLIEKLPEELQSAINMLVLIPESERKKSLTNIEFEEASRPLSTL